MKTVEKKILPQFFKAVVQGMKTFEYRKDDDDIQEGDIIKLSEIDADTKEKTGKWIVFGVGTVLRHKDWGDIPEGFCVISLLPFVNQNLTSCFGNYQETKATDTEECKVGPFTNGCKVVLGK